MQVHETAGQSAVITHRIAGLPCLVVGVVLALGCAPGPPEATGQWETVLRQMEQQGANFDTSLLHEKGAEGLDALLDRLLWQMPEVEGYAGRLVENYEAHQNESERYAEAFDAYVGEIDDDARLTLLAKRVRRSLEDHQLGRLNERGTIMQSAIDALAQQGQDKYPNLLEPLLEHPEESVATFVVRRVSTKSGHDYLPELQLTALESQRKPIVREALKWAPNCWDDSRRDDLKQTLIDVFEHRGEDLKLDAAFPLLHDFGYKPAVDYLVAQAKGDDAERARKALSWLGDKMNFPDGPPPDLAERLAPLREAEDEEIRAKAKEIWNQFQAGNF